MLQQEGYLTRSCLHTGFFALSKANISNNQGDFYVAFFQLSIGLERLMKLTLILDYMAANELQLPNTELLKDYQHDLIKLVRSIGTIGKRISESDLISEVLDQHAIENEILVFLDEFARKTRYSNLDTLTKKQGSVDPLMKWSKLSKRVFNKDIPQEVKQNLKNQTNAISQILASNTVVMASDLERKPLSFEDGLWQQSMFSTVAPLMLWRIMKIVYPIYEVMDNVCGLAQAVNLSLNPNEMVIPTMNEFFIDFISSDRDFVLDLEQWLIKKNA